MRRPRSRGAQPVQPARGARHRTAQLQLSQGGEDRGHRPTDAARDRVRDVTARIQGEAKREAEALLQRLEELSS